MSQCNAEKGLARLIQRVTGVSYMKALNAVRTHRGAALTKLGEKPSRELIAETIIDLAGLEVES